MTFIGNDIVHLKHSANKNIPITTRYLNKSFTDKEQLFIQQGLDIHAITWLLWSCKETAFKILFKMKQVQFFEPKKLEVSSIVQVSKLIVTSTIRYNAHTVYLVSYLEEDYVHSYGSNHRPALGRICFSVSNGDEKTESKRAREELLLLIHRDYPNISNPKIEKCDDHVPYLVGKGNPLPKDISLSHDYGIVSAVYLKA